MTFWLSHFLQLSKSYDETNAQGFPYEKFNYENKGWIWFILNSFLNKNSNFRQTIFWLDYYQAENDFNEPEFEPAEAMNEDF